jgi:hypothetical protein
MGVKLISLIAIFRKELFSSGVERRGSWAVIQPIEMICGGKNQWRIRGLERASGASKVGRPSLCYYVVMADKGVPQPNNQDRHDQSDN